MFGAGTDYCLLLLARYREESARVRDATALRRTAPAIVSAGGIVVAVMLVLTLAGYNATRWMGPVLAIGMAVTVLAGVTLLPAILVRARPLPAAQARERPSGRGSARFVSEKPLALTLAVGVVLVAGRARATSSRPSRSTSREQFRSPPESVEGLRTVQAKFPPGQAGPVDVLVDAKAVIEALPALRGPVYSADLVAFSTEGDLALVRADARRGPVHRAGDRRRSRRSGRSPASTTRARSSAAPRPRSSTTRPA